MHVAYAEPQSNCKRVDYYKEDFPISSLVSYLTSPNALSTLHNMSWSDIAKGLLTWSQADGASNLEILIPKNCTQKISVLYNVPSLRSYVVAPKHSQIQVANMFGSSIKGLVMSYLLLFSLKKYVYFLHFMDEKSKNLHMWSNLVKVL